MTKEKAEKIMRIYNWVRYIILVAFLTFVFVGLNCENLKTSQPYNLITSK